MDKITRKDIVGKYIGRPYSQYDCWELFLAIANDLGKCVPEVDINNATVAYPFSQKIERNDVRLGDVVLAEEVFNVARGKKKRNIHVMVSLGGDTLIHSTRRTGVVLTRLSEQGQFIKGFRRVM